MDESERTNLFQSLDFTFFFDLFEFAEQLSLIVFAVTASNTNGSTRQVEPIEGSPTTPVQCSAGQCIL